MREDPAVRKALSAGAREASESPLRNPLGMNRLQNAHSAGIGHRLCGKRLS